MKTFYRSAVCLTLASGLFGCEVPTQVQVSNTSVEAVQVPDSVPAVCNPFGDAQTPGRTSGLWGKLYYLAPEQPHYTHVADYQTYGHATDVDLFFNQLNIPTRPFDRGFVTQDGSILKTPNGDTVYEWFSLHMESVVQLSRLDGPGRYQFAVLSDDGAILKIDQDGRGLQSWINNDGTTPSRLRCATSTVNMDISTRLPISVDYFQGPRYHIALMVLWRQVPDSALDSELSDPSCNKSGNGLWFDSAQNPPVPQAEFINLLGRGWKVLTPENYLLPDHVSENPCSNPGGPGGAIGV